MRRMTRKLIALTAALFVCSQAFGFALLCKMRCCPETKTAVMQMDADSSAMPMHNHQHHLAMTADSHDKSCVSASTCTVMLKAPQPQIVRTNGAFPNAAQAAGSGKPVSLDLRQVATQPRPAEAAPLSVPAPVPLRI
jgi:hypothetical protein